MKKKLIALTVASLMLATGAETHEEEKTFGTTNIIYNGQEYKVTYLEKEGLNLFHSYESEGIPNPIFLEYSAGDFGVGSIDERTFKILTGKSSLESRGEFRRIIRSGLNEVLGIKRGPEITDLDNYR